MSLRTSLNTSVLSSLIVRAASTAAENARIIDKDGPDLPQRLLDCFLKLERLNDATYRSINLLRGRKSFPHIYGGQVVAHALKSATDTVDSSLSPHSMHCYFVKAGSVLEPVDYHVEKIRNGRSFATRLVRAVQENEILFTSQVSYQREESSVLQHQTKIDMPEGPEGLKDARVLMRSTLDGLKTDEMTSTKFFMAYKLAEFPPTFHRIFEARPVNQNIYAPSANGPLRNPTYHLWIKPVLNIGSNPVLHQYMAAYISDSTMVETAILPHITRGLYLGMAFSLDHCIWFHRTKFDINEWMLWEQESDYAALLEHLDEDDVLAHKEVEMNKQFEMGGEETEIDGLEPYIFLRYNCKKEYKEEVIYLGNTQFRDRSYYLRKNLDTGETMIY